LLYVEAIWMMAVSHGPLLAVHNKQTDTTVHDIHADKISTRIDPNIIFLETPMSTVAAVHMKDERSYSMHSHATYGSSHFSIRTINLG
jgi:hypothetical protein